MTIIVQQANESTETFAIDTKTGNVEFETSGGCAGTGTALVDGEPLGNESSSNEAGEEAEGSDDGSSTDAGGDDTAITEEDGGIPWGPIGVALALLAGVTAYTANRNRKKKDCKPEKEALDSVIRAAELAHDAFEPKQAALHDAIVNDAPKDVVDRARAERDEAQAAADTAMDAYRQARAAYQACRGSADTGDDLDLAGLAAGMGQATGDFLEPEPEGGGIPIPPEVPGVISETPEDVDDASECQPEETKWTEDPTLKEDFEVLAGNVVINSRMGPWNRLMGGATGIDPEDFGNITDADVEEALSGFDSQGKKVRLYPKIKVRRITVGCERKWECEDGTWVDSGETRRIEDVMGPIRSKSVGTQTNSTQKSEIVKHVEAVRAALETLSENRDAYEDFECS